MDHFPGERVVRHVQGVNRELIIRFRRANFTEFARLVSFPASLIAHLIRLTLFARQLAFTAARTRSTSASASKSHSRRGLSLLLVASRRLLITRC